MSDPYDFQRFLEAQAHSFDTALAEIRRGRKQGHWMWYIFPQIAGLGHSPMAQRYAIGSLEQARAYLDHPLLGARLKASITALQDCAERTPDAVFGQIDAMKLRSSLTLFHQAGGGALFQVALDRWFGGALDPATLDILG